MKFPICLKCAKSDTLCDSCESKLRNGEITELDVRISRLLLEIHKVHNITTASFEHAYDFGDTVVIFTKGDVGVLIGRKGAVVSRLSKELKKKVRIAQLRSDSHKTIEDLVAPARLLGINIVYTKDGEYHKIRIDRRTAHKLPVSIPTLERVAALLLKTKNIKITFE